MQRRWRGIYVNVQENQLCITSLNVINTNCISKFGINPVHFSQDKQKLFLSKPTFLFSCRPVFPFSGILSWLSRLWIRSQEAWPEAWVPLLLLTPYGLPCAPLPAPLPMTQVLFHVIPCSVELIHTLESVISVRWLKWYSFSLRRTSKQCPTPGHFGKLETVPSTKGKFPPQRETMEQELGPAPSTALTSACRRQPDIPCH